MFLKGSPVRNRASRLKRTGSPTKRPVPKRDKESRGVGAELKALFSRIGIQICAGCDRKAVEWDRHGIKWCQDNKPVLVEWLTKQAISKEVNLYETAMRLATEEPLLAAKIAAAKVMHPLTDTSELAAIAIVDFAIDRAFHNSEAFKITAPIPVIVSVAPRAADIHQRTFRSIRQAGFDAVFATCEPGTDETNVDAVIAPHSVRQGQWRNFVQALRLGVSRNAPYFITAEDDVEFCKGTAEFLALAGWPAADCGCVQLYSAKPMECYPAGRRSRMSDIHSLDLLGACALMFRRDAAIALIQWADTKGWRGHAVATIDEPQIKEAADTYVGEVLTFLGYSIWTHNPSLVDHIGIVSTLAEHNNKMGPNRQPLNFPGVDADLLSIFAEELNEHRGAV